MRWPWRKKALERAGAFGELVRADILAGPDGPKIRAEIEARLQQIREERAAEDAENERQARLYRIGVSARGIAERLYPVYRLAAIVTNAPDPAEKLETVEHIVAEALEVAEKIEDELVARKS